MTTKSNVNPEEMKELLNSISAAETSNYSARAVAAAAIVPISTMPASKRTKLVRPTSAAAQEYHTALLEQQIEFIDRDEIVRAIMQGKDAPHTLKLVKERIARAAAALDFIRLEQQKRGEYGKDVPNIVSKQISALKEVANIELEIRKLGTEALDLNHPKLQKIFELLINTFRDVATELLTTEQFDLLWNKLETELSDWEERADSLIR